MKALKITIEWDTKGSTDEANRIPTQEGMVNIFKSNKATSKEIQKHFDMVWNISAFGSDTPRYFDIFDTAPTDTASLDDKCNARKLKHVMMDNKLWNSLSSAFKIDITGSKEDYSCGQENDGPLLWDFICCRINPTTTVSASKLKDEIKSTKASAFDNNIIKYNTWFEDTRERIIKEEETGTMSASAPWSEPTLTVETKSLLRLSRMSAEIGPRGI